MNKNLSIILLFTITFFALSCKKNTCVVNITAAGLSTITTNTISNITNNEVTTGGNINSEGGSAIISKGVVWSTNPNPTISLVTKTSDGIGNGSFTSKIKSLTINTTYFIRAYATNSSGTSYGNEITFRTTNVDILTGLIAYFPFNGNANDESGNENHGVINGSTLTSDRNGFSNLAYNFSSGSNLIGTSKSYNSPNSISYSVWFKTSTATTFSHIIGFNNGQNLHGGSWDRTLYIKNNKIGFYTFNGAETFNEVDANVIDNKWHHCVVSMDQGGSKIYVDGNLLSTKPTQNIGQSNIGYFRIGGLSPNNANNSMVGSYDDVRIYNRALTQEQITYLSNL